MEEADRGIVLTKDGIEKLVKEPKRRKTLFDVPAKKLGEVEARKRKILRYAVQKLEVILKLAIYHLRGFDYTFKFGWDGPNPYLKIKVIFEEQKEKKSE